MALLMSNCGQAFALDDTAPVAYTANTLSNTVSVIDMRDNTVFATIYGIDSPTGLAVSPNTNRLYVTNSGTNNVTIIDTSNYRTIGMIPVGNTPFGIAVTPDGGTAYVANNWENTVSVINTTDKKVNNTINVGKGPYGVRVNPGNGDVYVINSIDGTVSVINGHSVVAIIPVGKNPTRGLAVTPDGDLLFVANTNSNNVSIIDTTTYKVVRTVDMGNSPAGIAISPDGLYAFIANSQNISILQISDYTIRVSFNAKDPSTIAFRPDGKVIYLTTVQASNLTAMDSATGEVETIFDINAVDIEAALMSSSVLVDTTPPATIVNLYGTQDANRAFISEVICNLTAVDYPSGLEVKTIQYSLDGITWIPYADNFTLKSPRTISVYYRASDIAGNTEIVKVKVITIVAPEAAASPSPSPGPSPTPTPLPVNASVTATPAPTQGPSPEASATPRATGGFEVVFAAMGILGAGYILVKKK